MDNNKGKRQFELIYGMVLLLLGTLVVIFMTITFLFTNRTIDSYQLIDIYDTSGDVKGEKVEVVVQEKGSNPMVGEFLWEERMDISYVTMNRINLDNVGVGDTVVVEVYDVVEIMGIYMVEIYNVEVVGQ